MTNFLEQLYPVIYDGMTVVFQEQRQAMDDNAALNFKKFGAGIESNTERGVRPALEAMVVRMQDSLLEWKLAIEAGVPQNTPFAYNALTNLINYAIAAKLIGRGLWTDNHYEENTSESTGDTKLQTETGTGDKDDKLQSTVDVSELPEVLGESVSSEGDGV